MVGKEFSEKVNHYVRSIGKKLSQTDNTVSNAADAAIQAPASDTDLTRSRVDNGLPPLVRTLVDGLPQDEADLARLRFMLAFHRLGTHVVPAPVIKAFTEYVVGNPQAGLAKNVRSSRERNLIRRFAQGKDVLSSRLCLAGLLAAMSVLYAGNLIVIALGAVFAAQMLLLERDNHPVAPIMIRSTWAISVLLMLAGCATAPLCTGSIVVGVSMLVVLVSAACLAWRSGVWALNKLSERNCRRDIQEAERAARLAEEEFAQAKQIAASIGSGDRAVADLATGLVKQLEYDAEAVVRSGYQARLAGQVIEAAKWVSEESDMLKRAEKAMRKAAECAMCANSDPGVSYEQISAEAYSQYADELLRLLEAQHK